MKTAILYASRTGSAQLCAEYIASKLSDCSLFNLEKETPSLSEYDVVLIGSGIRMGKLYGSVRKFLVKNNQVLSLKRTIIFLSNFYPDTVSKTLDKNVPKNLLENIDVLICGGKAPFSIALNINWMKCDEIDHFLAKHNLT